MHEIFFALHLAHTARMVSVSLTQVEEAVKTGDEYLGKRRHISLFATDILRTHLILSIAVCVMILMIRHDVPHAAVNFPVPK